MAARGQLDTVDGLAQLSFVVLGMLEAQAGRQDISMVQTRLLGVLRDRTPTMNELAALLDLDKSSVSGLVVRAERRGLVERVPSTTDRRVVRVTLTDAGRTLVSHVAARFEAEVSRLLDVLPAAERATLSGLISQVLVTQATSRGIELFPDTDHAAR